VQTTDFLDRAPGRLVRIDDGAAAFVPTPLPTTLDLRERTVSLLGEARDALGRLGEGAQLLPDPGLFIAPLQKQEAVLSSRIEGTRTTLEEALFDEAVGSTSGDEDLAEVRNYLRALQAGHAALARGRPLTVGLVLELHAELLRGVRGEDRAPGAFRTTQVWLGGEESRFDVRRARFVPPPPAEVARCMRELGDTWSSRALGDPLIRIALTHYQLETIHPFADGNGRIGRLLVSLQVLHEGLLERPWLYVSPFLEARREEYYRLLFRVSARGEHLEWVEFFLEAVRHASRHTLDKIRTLHRLDREYRVRLERVQSPNPLRLLDLLQRTPVLTVAHARRHLGVSHNTARAAVDRLVEARVLEPVAWTPPSARGRPPVLYACTDIVRLVGS
jgi:Fic family protein